jgi:hypothetical protein
MCHVAKTLTSGKMPSGKNNCHVAQRGMAENNSDSFYIDRAKWMDYVHGRRDFTHGEFRVAYFIASKINPEDDCMWYSVKRIARETPASLATVEKTIAKLDQCRLIYLGKRKIGRQTVDTYSFRMPMDAEDQAFRARKKTRKKTGGRGPRVSLDETSRVSLDETKSNNSEPNKAYIF